MLFGSSGIRRRYDLRLAELALALGYALAGEAGEVVVGTDTRTTGPILAGAAIAGLLSGGRPGHFRRDRPFAHRRVRGPGP